MENNTVIISRTFESMLISAERYACGRRTYIVSDTVEYITALLPKLSDWCITVMLKDMESKEEMAQRMAENPPNYSVCGDPQDKREWGRFIALCKEEMERRTRQQAHS